MLKPGPYNERFAFHANQLAELAALVRVVDTDRVYRRFCDWLKSRSEDSSTIDQCACEPFVDEFKMFSQGLEQAVQRDEALIW